MITLNSQLTKSSNYKLQVRKNLKTQSFLGDIEKNIQHPKNEVVSENKKLKNISLAALGLIIIGGVVYLFKKDSKPDGTSN